MEIKNSPSATPAGTSLAAPTTTAGAPAGFDVRTETPANGGRRARRLALGCVLLLSAVVFWRTAFPTITWWDSSSYSLAAATLGVTSPPGSLLLTLLGWPIAHVRVGISPAHALNLFAGLIAALAAAVVCAAGMSMFDITHGRSAGGPGSQPMAGADAGDASGSVRGRAARLTPERLASAAAGSALGALALAFSQTFWAHAVRFTPYILTVLVTGLMLWTLLRWWEEADRADSWRWIALLGLLVGLDFSVHRTNALLVPGALAWILIRRPRTLLSPRAILAGTGAVAAGLTLHLALIPMAAHSRSPLDFAHPSTLSAFWDYVTLQQLGGSFLLDLVPRKAPLFSVQTMDLLRMLGANFLSLGGRAGVFGVLPALAAIAGFWALVRRNRRLALAVGAVLVLQAALTVFYFNIPANFFRPLDRHYLPVCVTIAVLMAYGLGACAAWAGPTLLAGLTAGRAFAAAAAVAVASAVPAVQFAANWSASDASWRYVAHDYATNVLRSLPPNAIYFTVGDNDTFPVLYLQAVEGLRPDVTIINLSVANIPDWPERLAARDPALPISLSQAARMALTERTWKDTTVVLPVRSVVCAPETHDGGKTTGSCGAAESLGLPANARIPDSISLDVRPRDGTHLLPAEALLLDIVQTNRWRRPLAFAITGTRGAMEWLEPYGRLEGLYFRIVPLRDPAPDVALLRSRLFEQNVYRGYNRPFAPVDNVDGIMTSQYYSALVELLAAERRDRGGAERCLADARAFEALVPVDRTSAPPEIRRQLAQACTGT